ncbi:MAG: transposase [Pigmentiphaga sp.]
MRHRYHSIEFKHQVVQEHLGGETLHGLAKRHDVSRQLIPVWIEKYEAGDIDDDARASDLIQQYNAHIAAIERFVGKQALELEFLWGVLNNAPHRKSGTTSVITGPEAAPFPKDASWWVSAVPPIVASNSNGSEKPSC